MLSSLRISLNICKSKLNIRHNLTSLRHLKTTTPKHGTIAIAEVSSKSKTVGLWLAGCSGMVAGAVVLGGVTR